MAEDVRDQVENQPSEEDVQEYIAEHNNREYLKKRHQQAVDELKVSSDSSKPQLVMGLALVGVFALILLVARIIS